MKTYFCKKTIHVVAEPMTAAEAVAKNYITRSESEGLDEGMRVMVNEPGMMMHDVWMTMETFRSRYKADDSIGHMEAEQEELHARRMKLIEFIHGDRYKDLPQGDREALSLQLDSMATYENVLISRIVMARKK